MFSVESAGEQDIEAEAQNMLVDFIQYIKKKKVVIIEDLANEFSIKSTDVRSFERMPFICFCTFLIFV